MIKILIVEDEEAIANLIKIHLERVGYYTKHVDNGEKALQWIEQEKFDLILLDIMIPGIDGFSLMEYLQDESVPVIFLTAMDSVVDKVKGLKLGAEDYITKPFEPSELLARIEVVLRRYHKAGDVISFKNIQINLRSRTVKKDGIEVELTKKEFDILLLFWQNRRMALYREVIYEKVWGEDFMGDTRTIDLHVQRLRKKLGLEREIQTVYKIGYRFEDTDEISN